MASIDMNPKVKTQKSKLQPKIQNFLFPLFLYLLILTFEFWFYLFILLF